MIERPIPPLLDALLDACHDAFIAIDSQGNVIRWNNMATKLFGWHPGEAMGRPMAELIVPEAQRDQHERGMKRFQETGEVRMLNRRVTLQARRRDGEIFPVEMTVSMGEDQGRVVFFSFLHDLSERRRTEDQLLEIARTDTLTGLPNRRHVRERLDAAIAAAKRRDRGLAVLFIDLDQFKVINDLQGHHVGDMVLKELAKRLKANLRQNDFIGRLGGDEFLLLMEDVEQDKDAVIVADKLLDLIAEPMQLEPGKPLVVTASIGLSIYQGDETTSDILIRQADEAMYRAKRDGRARLAKWHDRTTPASVPPAAPRAPFFDFMEKVFAKPQANPGFGAREQFLQDALRATREHFGMDVAFISKFEEGRRVFEQVDPPVNSALIQQGNSDPLEETFCQRVVDGRLPECLPDAMANSEASSLPATREIPVRAHLSVPLLRKDGSVYGTLCCFSHAPDMSLNERDVDMLRVMSVMLNERMS
ncbi:diguanylate cyclase [Noviherbaspirillum galbum]|uniref:Diguanylate cyclase n=1 Tax=Noviherbaspirillum galbum TaxID=2709383 RepID=A0A6B3SGI8_9BURK|nr:diguanylate cyclase [Noviherbaspirillum galbum]NEX59961.1 diguanylate cyclase [Noviherbaspirillum galbum]